MIQNIMIINASLLFNLVEHIDFKNLITTGYPNRHVLSRKTLIKNIEAEHQVLLQNMKSIFSKVKGPSNSYNFPWLKVKMFDQSSGVEIVQDGSKKTDIEILKSLEDSIEGEYDENKRETDDDADSEKDEELVFLDIEKALLPNVSKLPSMLNYRKQSRLTFSKSQALWNKQNRLSQIADIIKTNLGVYLKTPNQTRWNCRFNSSKFLLLHFKNNPSKFTKVCDALKLNRFSKDDLEILEEYVVVMELLCICLDVLQGEKNMYFGFLLPSITMLLRYLYTVDYSRRVTLARAL
ncbi:hypothetical protein QTP88_027369 [Uroleucon formosanum]